MKIMRNIMVVLFVVVGFIGSCAQDISQKDVPSIVLNAFMTKYPQATDVEWERQGNIYNVEFELLSLDNECWYDVSGKLLKHKKEIKITELPQYIFSIVQKDFSDYKLDIGYKVEENGEIFYIIELDGSPNDRVLHISPEGKIIDNRVDY